MRAGKAVAVVATGKLCGVPTEMLQGKSWAPPPSTGQW